MHLLRCLFNCSKQFLNSILMSLVLLLFFVSPLPHGQNTSLCGLLSSGETKKVAGGKTWWIGRVGRRDHAGFGQKLLNMQCGVSRCARKSLIMNCAKCIETVFKKNSLKLNKTSHNNASWHTATDGSLECSPSRGSPYQKGTAPRR